MGVPDSSKTAAPPASALQKCLDAHPLPTDSPHSSDFHNLALQIAHNLRYQHQWSGVRLHTVEPSDKSRPLPRPMLSGVPPNRLYVHPDEQIELLQIQKDEGKTGMPDLEPHREWVLPSHLREKWTLRRFGEAFDAIERSPADTEGELLFDSQQPEGGEGNSKWRENLPKRLLLGTLDDDSTVVYYIVHDGIVKPRQN
ncbi:hypothetical protein PRZ48_001144 [Zasmidium cellare]|uniref:tRNA-splicing endonuclease subunit Sen15 domain-containing protein n=1 Tax=Zasmidium cellare TaxID=395010 RepID=A0ABR0F0G6_ZASCE|nr:hypothetical protein PRZ48_001144 [Zasmidium cellare]